MQIDIASLRRLLTKEIESAPAALSSIESSNPDGSPRHVDAIAEVARLTGRVQMAQEMLAVILEGVELGQAPRRIPPLMAEGIARYFDHRIRPGSCLRAILENDLTRAVQLADSETRDALPWIVLEIYAKQPANAWGSTEKVARWLAGAGGAR